MDQLSERGGIMNYDDPGGDILGKWKKPTCLKSIAGMISHPYACEPELLENNY